MMARLRAFLDRLSAPAAAPEGRLRIDPWLLMQISGEAVDFIIVNAALRRDK
jgi:hypothetical protein